VNAASKRRQHADTPIAEIIETPLDDERAIVGDGAGGSLIVGDKGTLYAQNDYAAMYKLMGNVNEPKVETKPSPGHFEEWVRAIKTKEPAMSNFPDYAGPLTETILLGNLAVWADGKKIEWDAKRLRAKNAPEVAHIIRPSYRAGYAL